MCLLTGLKWKRNPHIGISEWMFNSSLRNQHTSVPFHNSSSTKSTISSAYLILLEVKSWYISMDIEFHWLWKGKQFKKHAVVTWIAFGWEGRLCWRGTRGIRYVHPLTQPQTPHEVIMECAVLACNYSYHSSFLSVQSCVRCKLCRFEVGRIISS